jgi:hypothetical protein
VIEAFFLRSLASASGAMEKPAVHPWQKCLRKIGKQFAKAADQFQNMRLAIVSVPDDAVLNLPEGRKTRSTLIEKNLVMQARLDWGIDFEKKHLPGYHSENGVVLLGDPEAIARYRFLAGEAVASLPATFWIRPPIFPTQLPHLAEESRLHRWAEFVLIASCGSWQHRIDDPKKPMNRYSFTVRNAFGASSEAILWICGDPASDARLHQLNASHLLATFNGDPLPEIRTSSKVNKRVSSVPVPPKWALLLKLWNKHLAEMKESNKRATLTTEGSFRKYLYRERKLPGTDPDGVLEDFRIWYNSSYKPAILKRAKPSP